MLSNLYLGIKSPKSLKLGASSAMKLLTCDLESCSGCGWLINLFLRSTNQSFRSFEQLVCNEVVVDDQVLYLPRPFGGPRQKPWLRPMKVCWIRQSLWTSEQRHLNRNRGRRESRKQAFTKLVRQLVVLSVLSSVSFAFCQDFVDSASSPLAWWSLS